MTLAIWSTCHKLLQEQKLSGAKGCNRHHQTPHIQAYNDLQAIECWLQTYQHQPKTQRNYRKDAERLLLWSLIERHKAFSDLLLEDFQAYISFLANPQPFDRWCGTQKAVRHSPDWRPFRGPLKPNSIETAMGAIRSLMIFLVKARYLAHDPLSLLTTVTAQPDIPQNFHVAERILSVSEWQAVLATLEELPETTERVLMYKKRLRWLVAVLYFLGLRVEELTTHTMGHFKCLEGYWWFFVIGKGNKAGKIPVNQHLLAELKVYREHIGREAFPGLNETTPLISTQHNPERSLTTRRVHQLIKELGEKTAARLVHTQPTAAAHIQNLSPHWLRHLSASMQDRAGVSFNHIRANHRHQRDSTTRQYVHAFDAERHHDMEKLPWCFSESDNSGSF